MGIFDQWPEYMPTISVTLTVSAGTVTIGAGSAVENAGDYGWDPDQLRGTLLKNGAIAAPLLIDSSTGEITMASGVAVSANDEISAHFRFVGKVSEPWVTRVICTRTCTITISGNGSTVFDEDDNAMPVPSWDLAFGWDANDKLKVGVKVNSADSSSEDIKLKTRLLGGAVAKETSRDIDLTDTTNAQTHTSSFSSDEIEVACEMRFALVNDTSNPMVEDNIRILIFEPTEVDDYPASFPTTGTMVNVTKPAGYWSAKLDEA
jgi:hypothetical protein